MILVSGASEAMVLGGVSTPGIRAGVLVDLRLRSLGPFLRTAKRPEDAPRRPENAMSRPGKSGWDFAQHFQAGHASGDFAQGGDSGFVLAVQARLVARSEEHTSELQSLMRNSSAVFCWKKNKNHYKP